MAGDEIKFNFAKSDGCHVQNGMPVKGKENKESSKLNSLFSLKKLSPIEMPMIKDKSNDIAFDRTHEITEKGIKPSPIDFYPLDKSTLEKLSNIDLNKLMEDFQNKYRQ